MQFGNKHGLNCARNETDRASHIWDQRDAQGRMGATACVVVPWFADRHAEGADWRALAWWIHDHLPYHALQFFPKLAAFNITWREEPERIISSYIAPRGILTRPGMANHGGDHSEWYRGFRSRRAESERGKQKVERCSEHIDFTPARGFAPIGTCHALALLVSQLPHGVVRLTNPKWN